MTDVPTPSPEPKRYQPDVAPKVSPSSATTAAGFPVTPPPNPNPTKPPVKHRARGAFPTWIWWIVGVMILAVAGFFLFFWRGSVTVTVIPGTASVTVADTSGVGSVTRTLSPGTYPILIQAQGYIPFSSSVTIKRNEKAERTIELRTVPLPIRLSEARVQFLVLDSERKSLLYLEPSKKRIERLFFENTERPSVDPITPDRFSTVTDFLWSPDRQLAFYRESSSLKQYDFNRYDLVNQTVSDWPSEIHGIGWRPDGQKVAYVYADSKTGERTLVRATKDNEELERILNFEGTTLTDPSVIWSPDAKWIALLENQLFLFEVFSKTLRPIKLPEAVAALRWSPTSDRVLYQTKAGKLGLVDLEGVATELGLDGPVSRSVFTSDGKALLYASGRGTTVRLERINLETKEKTSIPIGLSTDLSPDHLLLGAEDKQLFFQSGGQPYVLDLDTGVYPELTP